MASERAGVLLENVICIEQLGVYALRHTLAAQALESGMDLRTLSEIPGRVNISLTLQLYAHSTVETKLKAMNCMEKFLWFRWRCGQNCGQNVYNVYISALRLRPTCRNYPENNKKPVIADWLRVVSRKN